MIKFINTIIFCLILFSSSKNVSQAYFTAVSSSQAAGFTFSENISFETIQNGNFSDDWNGWNRSGYSDIFNNNNFVQTIKIGFQSDGYESSSISQFLNLNSTQKHFLFLAYKLKSAEILSGFDEPSFLILLDNKPIFTTSRDQLAWKNLVIPLPVYQEPVELKVMVQNTADNQRSPTLEIAYLSTEKPFAYDFLPETITTDIDEILPIDNSDQYSSNSDNFLKILPLITKFPINSYVLSSDSQNYEAKLTQKTVVNEAISMLPAFDNHAEILSLSESVTPGTYQLNALDSHGRILAAGEIQINNN